MPAADQAALLNVLIGVLDDGQHRTGHRHDGYAPAPLATAHRHGIYSANLVLLILAVGGPVTGSALFPGARDPAGRWRGTVLLWRSALGELPLGGYRGQDRAWLLPSLLGSALGG